MGPTYAVSTRCPAIKIEEMMKEHSIQRVPVVDQENRLVGIVTNSGLFSTIKI
jgi:CBS domain-containing protein